MLNQRTLSLFLLPVVLAGFVFGIAKLFQLRFGHGDIYPPASSLRADPLGTKVFYESLRELNSLEVSRLYEPLNKIGHGDGKTLFVLGTEPWALRWVPGQEIRDIEKFLREGGRVVFSFQPLAMKNWEARREEKREAEEKEDETEKQKARKKKRKNLPLDEDEFRLASLWDKWNLQYSFADLEMDDEGVAIPEIARNTAEASSLPESLAVHTSLVFDNPSDDWKTIFARGTNAVMVERSFGKGSVVLSADSYFFSNEAMSRERHPGLLAWMVGPNQIVIFDETHLGVHADPGIAALARKYRLHGLVLGLFLLAGLFVWKNSASLVPPHTDDVFEGRNAVVMGKESSAGFVNLLRRGISPSEIISTCSQEWKKSGAHQRQKSFGKIQKIEELLAEENSRPARERNPVETYRKIATLLAERK